MTIEEQKKNSHIVILHGLYMSDKTMVPMRQRFEERGWQASCFDYSTLFSNLEKNVLDLKNFVDALNVPEVHFVGHSLGGLVIRGLFDRFPCQRPGRIVTLGTPHQGASLAKWFQDNFLGWGIGKAREKGLLDPMPDWLQPRELGSIAGLCDGTSWRKRLIRGDTDPSDGVVTLEETCLPGMMDHCVVETNHENLVYEEVPFVQAEAFLRQGRFQRQYQAWRGGDYWVPVADQEGRLDNALTG